MPEPSLTRITHGSTGESNTSPPGTMSCLSLDISAQSTIDHQIQMCKTNESKRGKQSLTYQILHQNEQANLQLLETERNVTRSKRKPEPCALSITSCWRICNQPRKKTQDGNSRVLCEL